MIFVYFYKNEFYMKIANWAGTRTYNPEKTFSPRNEEEVCQIVKNTVKEGRKLKVIGSGLSFSDAPAIEQDVLILNNMSNILKINKEEPKITVQGGANIREINRQLAENGLGFKNFGSIVMQTAAGYTGTATHGTGIRTQILSADITEMKLVDGSGNPQTLNRNQNPELFNYARVHLGLLGIITEITFDCKKAFDVEEELKLLDFDTVLANLNKILQENEYCKLWWMPHTNKIQVYTYNSTTRPRTRTSLKDFLETSGLSTVGFSALIYLSRLYPKMTTVMNQIIQSSYFTPHIRRNQSDALFNISKMIPTHDEMEYAIPIENAAKAIDETRNLIQRNKHFVNFPMEVRFVAQDDIPLSPAYQRDICYIGAYTSIPKLAEAYFRDFENMVKPYQGRPHWGKNFYLTSEEFQKIYPKFHEFSAMRKNIDPNNIFSNRFSKRVFGY